MLDEMASRRFLEAEGVPFNAATIVRSADEVEAALESIPLPVAMKVVSPDIIHKSDAGCVLIGIDSAAEARQAFSTITDRARAVTTPERIEGISVQQMVTGNAEAFLGGHWTPQFGPVLVVGLGGVMVELLRDVSMRLCPLERSEVEEMLEELSSVELLRGYRGRPAGDVDAFIDLAVRASEIMASGAVDELDLNPVMVLNPGEGVMAVDARVSLREEVLARLPDHVT